MLITVCKQIFFTPLYLFVYQLSFQGVYNKEDVACHKGMWNIKWTFSVLIWWWQQSDSDNGHQ